MILSLAGESKLSLITNDNGGIIDDTVITNHGSYMYVSHHVDGRLMQLLRSKRRGFHVRAQPVRVPRVAVTWSSTVPRSSATWPISTNSSMRSACVKCSPA